MSLIYKLGFTVLFLLVVFISGVVLDKFGKPFNPLVFNIHKLIALAFVIFASILTYNFFKSTGWNTFSIIISVFFCITILALFITGALISIGRAFSNKMLFIHNIGSVLILVATVFIGYKLIKNN